MGSGLMSSSRARSHNPVTNACGGAVGPDPKSSSRVRSGVAKMEPVGAIGSIRRDRSVEICGASTEVFVIIGGFRRPK